MIFNDERFSLYEWLVFRWSISAPNISLETSLRMDVRVSENEFVN